MIDRCLLKLKMGRYFLFFILQLLLLSSDVSFSLVGAATNETDASALLSFKSLISSDPYGTLSSWNGSIHHCQWKGVRCGHRHPDRVTALTLGSVKLSGRIAPSVANLTFLQTLNLSDNQLMGTIPEELGLLSRLKFLNLSVNSLEGSIPSTVGNCSNLEYLNIRNNNLQGDIPPEIMNCRNLVTINLKNNLLSGSIPPEIGTLQQLTEIFLDVNNLTGPIPPTMGNLTSLLSINLGSNRLSGFIPSSLGKLQFLQNLYLGFNDLSGEIPHSLYNLSAMVGLQLILNQVEGTLSSNMCDTLPNLKYLMLFGNRLEGQIPTSISNCSALTLVGLDSNYFTGTIPDSVGTLPNIHLLQMASNRLEAKRPSDWSFIDKLSNCTNLLVLDIGDNQLQGTIPNTIGNISKSVSYLGLDANQISGSIPTEISKLTNLVTLELGQASLEGTIPEEIGQLWNLRSLGLSWNMLTGEIPSTFGNFTKLIKLDLRNNALTGNIPVELGKLQVLDLLMLSNNKLTVTIPKEIFNISSLSIGFDLSNNYLNGSIPPEIGRLNNVAEVNLSNNKLSGQIPTTIDGCQVLQVLHLDGNMLEGAIPSSLSNMKGLQYLDISNNTFSGPIPEFLGEMKLQHLNISYNNFEGALPKDGVFKDTSTVDIIGNPKLCGGVPEMHLPKCVLDSKKNIHRYKKNMVIILCSTSAFICLGIVMCFVTRYYWKRRIPNNPQPVTLMKSEFQKVSYNDILRATNDFSLENLIGRGGFGSVYRASMKFENGSTVAVKVLNLEVHGASRSFLSECEVLKKVRHRNLIKVLSACSSIDNNGNVFKALIFEFKPNGNLETWLHPNACTNRPFRCLGLIERLNVAIDVATALDYLHNNGSAPIVHCDLKPSNVLLDDDMTACVSDFGLARFLVPANTMSSRLSESSIGIKGSIGYIPPEYGMGGKPSIEGDMYSFGILLLEMFTGTSPTDARFMDGLSLHDHVNSMAFPDQIMHIIDPKLFSVNLGTEKTWATQDVCDCLVSVVRCGLMCSAAAPKDRMGIKQVVRELVSDREILLK